MIPYSGFPIQVPKKLDGKAKLPNTFVAVEKNANTNKYFMILNYINF
jgi:hypothetical protein